MLLHRLRTKDFTLSCILCQGHLTIWTCSINVEVQQYFTRIYLFESFQVNLGGRESQIVEAPITESKDKLDTQYEKFVRMDASKNRM